MVEPLRLRGLAIAVGVFSVHVVSRTNDRLPDALNKALLSTVEASGSYLYMLCQQDTTVASRRQGRASDVTCIINRVLRPNHLWPKIVRRKYWVKSPNVCRKERTISIKRSRDKSSVRSCTFTTLCDIGATHECLTGNRPRSFRIYVSH